VPTAPRIRLVICGLQEGLAFQGGGFANILRLGQGRRRGEFGTARRVLNFWAARSGLVCHGCPTACPGGVIDRSVREWGVTVQRPDHGDNRAGAHPAEPKTADPGIRRGVGGGDQSKLLPLLAVERVLRAVILIGVGLILLTHVHADWVDTGRRFAERVGLDPSRNETGKLITRLAGFGPQQAARDGIIAVVYGLLEAVEGYGLFRRRPWAEYLTVISTALLLIPEIQELLKRPTDLKIVGLVLNIVIVSYLIVRLLRRRGSH